MAELPAMPIFADAYKADTDHLTDAEHGRYFLILLNLWLAPDCRLPNDDKWLARKFRRTEEQVKAELRPIIDEFCQCSKDWITQKRLSKEKIFVKEKRKKNRDAAKSRWNNEKNICERNATGSNANAMPPTQPNPTLNNKTPTSLPQSPREKGFLKNGEVVFSIASVLHDEATLDAAKMAAPGWDVYRLAGIYDEGVASRGRPKNPAAAFVGWCGKYTKGKRP